MKNLLVLFAALAATALAQETRWSATTGDVSLSAAGTTATVQVVTINNATIPLDYITVYCSVACNASQAANGTAATATAGTVVPLLPSALGSSLPVRFFTASNVGAGTNQGGIIHIPAGATVIICLSSSCPASPQNNGNGQSFNVTLGPVQGGPGTGTNYSVTISSITGTANITFFGRVS